MGSMTSVTFVVQKILRNLFDAENLNKQMLTLVLKSF